MRKSWDHYFMDIAFKVASRGTCKRLQVGSVLVKDKKIKSTGYNGSPEGLPHCIDDGCYMDHGHCIRCTHSEVNCLNNSDVRDKEGGTLYVTDYPCSNCQQVIISSKIKRVVYFRKYTPNVDWLKMCPNIEVVCLEDYQPTVILEQQEVEDVLKALDISIRRIESLVEGVEDNELLERLKALYSKLEKYIIKV